MQFLTNTNFDFAGRWRIAVSISVAMILAGLVSLVVHGGPKWSIDFQGGQIVEIRSEPALDLAAVRGVLASANVGLEQVQHFGSDEELLIYLAADADLGVAEGTKTIPQILKEAFPDSEIELRREEKVGPKIGQELRTGAINSVIVAIALIMLYITIRFTHFQFGLGAVVALVHDVLITLGIFSLIGKEISLVILAAFLTIIGYSLNDTIIVYDRIRENMSMRRKESYSSVVNRSLNETLSRTVITSGTTLLVAVVLFIFGGPVIHDFALALTIGVLVGTYSSLYVATPVVIGWYQWRSGDRTARGKEAPAKA